MILYKVYAGMYENGSKQFIVGKDKQEALQKYVEITKDPDYLTKVNVEKICKRDVIIPCTDPRKEFENEQVL
jgi:hypothetical protein